MRYFGLDGEMSAASVTEGGRLIQLGLVAHTRLDGTETDGTDTFSAIMNPGDMRWESEAEAVHGFTRAEIEAAPAAADVDDAAYAWLAARGANDNRRGGTIAVGFNVGSFDLPHLQAVLPRTAALFSRRTVDLNAVCFTLEGASYRGAILDFTGWKRAAKSYAERTIAQLPSESGPQAHDAGYDAQLHLFAWRFLRAAIHGQPLLVPNVPSPMPTATRMTLTLVQAVGIEEASRRTGIPEVFLRGWMHGGRATNAAWIDALAREVAAA